MRGLFSTTDCTDLNTILLEASSCSEIAIDTETNGLKWLKHKAFAISVAFGHSSYYIPNSQYNVESISVFLSKLFSLNAKFIFLNSKFDAHMIRETYGIEVPWEKVYDIYTIASLYNSQSKHDLKSLAEEYIDKNSHQYENEVQRYISKNGVNDYSRVPYHIMSIYGKKDAEYTLGLFPILYPRLDPATLSWYTYERELLGIVYRLEKRGFPVDREYLSSYRSFLQQELEAVTKTIREMVGYAINPASNEQVSELLFKNFKLPVLKKTTNQNPSVDEESISSLHHPIIPFLLRHSKVEKILGTYVIPILELSERDGKLHSTYNPLGARTGRFSSEDPNFQNMPKELGVREAFIGDLTDADHSQLELRVFAHVAQEQSMIHAFKNGKDLHQSTASEMLNIPYDQVTSYQRFIGKGINFGIVFGEGHYTLSKQLKCDYSQAISYLTTYHERYPSIKKVIKKLGKEGERDGFIKTLFGRKIYVRGIPDYKYLNYKVQGSARDILVIGLLAISALQDSALVNTVHDSGVLNGFKLDLLSSLNQKMIDVSLSVPLVIDFKRGQNWGEWNPETNPKGLKKFIEGNI